MTEEEFSALAEEPIEVPETEETKAEGVSEQQEPEEMEGYETTEAQEEGGPDETEGLPQKQQRPQRQLTAAEQAQRAALEQEYRDSFNKINPYTGKPIQSPADFFAYKRQYAAEMARVQKYTQAQNIFEGIRNGTATQADFDRYVAGLVNTNPNIRAAKEAVVRVEQRERQSRVSDGKNRMQADIDQLNKEYPACDIKKVEDLNNNPEMIGYLRRGLSISDAYYLTHRNEMIEAQKAGVRQAVVNQANGKKHLQTTTDSSKGQEPIPEDVLAEYKHFFDWDDEQIIKDYKKRHKGGK